MFKLICWKGSTELAIRQAILGIHPLSPYRISLALGQLLQKKPKAISLQTTIRPKNKYTKEVGDNVITKYGLINNITMDLYCIPTKKIINI